MPAWVCSNCGFRVNGGMTDEGAARHECDPRSVIRYQTERLEESWATFLDSAEARFTQWLIKENRW